MSPSKDSGFSIWDHDVVGYASAGGVFLNGLVSAAKGGMFMEAGLVPGAVIAYGAYRYSSSPSDAHVGAITSGLVAAHFAWFKSLKCKSFIPASLLCGAGIGLSGVYGLRMAGHTLMGKKQVKKDTKKTELGM